MRDFQWTYFEDSDDICNNSIDYMESMINDEDYIREDTELESWNNSYNNIVNEIIEDIDY